MAEQQSTFDSLLGKLSSLLGDDAPEGNKNALLQRHPSEMGPAPGMRSGGNMDMNLSARPKVRNVDGSISTIRSASFGTDAGEVLLPTVTPDGRILSDQEALQNYRKTGQHMGIFDTPEHATAYAEMAHKSHEKQLPRQVAYRASMLPIGNYEDGSIAFPVWPQGAVDAYEAMGRFHRGESPQPQDAVLAGLAMAGGGFGGLGARGAGRAVSGTAPERVAASRPLASSPVEAGSGPINARVYRGSALQESWPPSADRPSDTFWASSDPDVADFYAFREWPEELLTPEQIRTAAPHTYAADVSFQNPMIVNAGGSNYRGFMLGDRRVTADLLAREARNAGHDGLVVRNIQDAGTYGGPNATTYAALQPGTVKSATTGETLFSNPKEGAPAGLLAASSLERMRAEDAIKSRPFPDAPQNLNELETYLQKNVDGNSRTRADEAWAEDPGRYYDYANGLGQVVNPDSPWWTDEPTLQSGGSMAPVAATSSTEHHSRSQPRGQGGRFVGKDSFDGRFAALDKMMVDLDGDGTPDVALPVRPANALMQTAKADYHGTDPTMGPFDIMNPMPSFPSLDYTQDMAVPPDWTINRVPQNTPVMGPGMNPPIPPGYMPPNRR